MAAKKLSESFSKRLIDEVQRWGAMKQTGVSLRTPNSIARRAIELETLPYGLSQKPAILKYRSLNSDREKMLNCHKLILDRFYMSRIGIRMLIGQHVVLHDPNPPDCVGYIHTKMSPVEVARTASEDARSICLREYGSAPDVKVYGDPSFTFPYVPTHLHLMVFELVKNSLRAVQERFMDSDKIAPCVSDEGGGIPRSGLPKIFTYLYSTAKNPLDEQSDLLTANVSTMAGYGYGLPISRLYARDRCISSLVSLGDSQEPLP
ncbi:pyruvate dehydrogenase kinase [Actinidia rufa]|uniref:Protein-serine/threonine kinase n=1 Tax=Actinidia rufa TaxID=165716 RepID=A0A7J0ESJ5_9ERIC|nr:pyruvate dehydrogenase kinase [Actinidia rufa]